MQQDDLRLDKAVREKRIREVEKRASKASFYQRAKSAHVIIDTGIRHEKRSRCSMVRADKLLVLQPSPCALTSIRRQPRAPGVWWRDIQAHWPAENSTFSGIVDATAAGEAKEAPC